ncbi:hybrid sensor histidine kinase/response regulator transcription factor [Pedobacter sp. SYSU D00535]|uniref:hybrid sensor histidine kinase/response regulator transcription factor n=1 Tax=Pedobacter sp. SYSU D00535 TaxID=2810308 RepID=UPI001A96F88C|nr:hybrid sensor histidine kinase/response regulator transcription factor [Pedobacter sp. SYSU D00535]
MFSRFIFFLACIVTPALVLAQQGGYQFSHLTVRDGLPHNQINCIYKDQKGFIWFGTVAGLARFDGFSFKLYQHKSSDSTTVGDNDIRSINEGPGGKMWVESRVGVHVYDPKTDRFTPRVDQELRKLSIPDNTIKVVRKDKSNNFWFISGKTGLYRFDPRRQTTSYIKHILRDRTTISSSPIIDLRFGPNDEPWLIHVDGLLERIDRKTEQAVQRVQLVSKQIKIKNDTYKIFIDSEGDLWVYDSMFSQGVFYVDKLSGTVKTINKTSFPYRLSSNIVSGIIEDANKKIWIATDHGGLNIIDKANRKVGYIFNQEDNEKSISQNNLSSIYYDDLGTLWVGTYKRGVNYFHPGIVKFGLVKHSRSPNSLVYNDINDFVEDRAGNLWIATNGKGLTHYNRKLQTFKTYQHVPSDPNSLAHDAVVCTYFDKAGKLWVGTYSGGLDYFDGTKFHHFKHNPTDATSISDNRISAILEDSSGRFWITTMGGGLNLFDKDTKRFKAFNVQGGHLNSNYIFCILEDSRRNIWIGTGYGLSVLPYNSGKFFHVVNRGENGNSLVHNSINCLREDSKGNIWIGTREGLSIYNPRAKKFANYSVADGLPDNNIQELESDKGGNFWISTSNGLSKASVQYGREFALKFTNFDESDGLQGKEFNRAASLKLKSGELVFGGADGFNIFDPAKIKINKNRSPLFITDLQLFNKSVKVGEVIDGDVVLDQSILDTKELILKSHQNVFTIAFAALNYLEPHKVKHQYMMEGFDRTWTTAETGVRKATYTNLDAGDYTFKVRVSSPDGGWTEDPLELRVRVLPPFYKSSWAYTLYALAFFGCLYLIRQRGIRKLKSEFAAEQDRLEMQRVIDQEKAEAKRLIEQERLEAMRYRELDALKIKFLTNISHEFRTPLSLILAPIEKLLKQNQENPKTLDQIAVIKRNARRLLHLVNQLLDFRKMELKELKLQKRSGDIVKFVKEIAFSFKDIAEQKKIQLTFNSAFDELVISFDQDKVERILFNLLSNAFKFTLEGGRVSVTVDITTDKQLEIKVRDTGIGIERDKQAKIFESFFQNEIPDAIINQGSGIGLSIAKEFARLHGGDILLESEVNLGSCFTLLLPSASPTIDAKTEEPLEEIIVGDSEAVELVKPEDSPVSTKKLTVLIVEDDADFRFYLKDNLKEDFNVIEAGNGKEGWQKALFYHPSIVVTDISMPEMNGIELCKKIKNDNRTLHIPVVLLTANTGEQSHLEGLGSGANDYMTKPFSFEILQTKLRNLLKQQESFRKTYQRQVEVKPADVEIESADEKFLQEAIKIIEKNISNTNFSIDELSVLLYVSRVTLYKRIFNLTGKTPLEFLKSYRMKRAVQLLERGDFTISQVSYKVGFKTARNFVKSFKTEFGVVPSKYLQSKDVSASE